MRLRVELNVTSPAGQQVTTESGELVEGIKEVRWAKNAADRPIVVLEMFAEKVDFETGTNKEQVD